MLHLGATILCGAALLYGTDTAAKDKTPLPQTGTAGEKIHIIADRLEADHEARFAEFIGNVKATQGDMMIESDRLRIYYKDQPAEKAEKEAAAGGEEYIEKVVASGNVKIMMQDRIAYTEEAVYTAGSGVFVLTGPQTRVESGKNYITGEKITVYRNSNRLIVQGDSRKRVEAVFYSQEAPQKGEPAKK